MTLKEARDILELGLTATRQEISRAYRRAARRWHPDRAPDGREEEYRAHMQQVNAAYQRLKEFLENYRFPLEDTETEEDVEEWWQERFFTGVWSRPPKEHRESQEKATKADPDKNTSRKGKRR
jgi:DnaJ-class molecular chaperone